MPPEIATAVTNERGHAGLSLGWKNELFDDHERTPELRWPESIKVYDQMRRTESKVQGTERALNLPILRSQFRIRPKKAKPEIVERLSRNLGLSIEGDEDPERFLSDGRRRLRFSFNDHIRHALLQLPYGHMAFEQVYSIGDDGFASIRKLAPRMPRTIATIKVAPDGGLEGIEQWPASPAKGAPGALGMDRPFIGVDRLVWYATSREGGDWTGRSILRPVYRNYLLRNDHYRLDGLAKRRNSMGVPVVERTIPQPATPDEEAAAEEFARQFRAGEFSGGYLPYGFTLRLRGVEGALADSLESAKHHGEEISSGMLVGFLDLGRTETGSRALGETFVDFFMQTENAVLGDLLDVFNEHVVEDWVDLNWGEDEAAPQVIAPEVGSETAPTAEALGRLIELGAIRPDKGIRQFLRRTFRLPAETEEDEPAPSGTTYQYDLDYQIVTIDERRAQIGLPPLPNGAGAVPPVPPEQRTEQLAATINRRRHELGMGPISFGKPLKAAAAPQFRRQLFAHELRARTDFETIQATWQSALDKLLDDFKGVRDAQVESLLDQVRELVDADDVAALGALSVDVADATSVLEEAMTQVAEQARDEAVAEAGRQGIDLELPDLDTDVISDHATRIAMLMGQDLATVVGRKAGENAALSGAQAAERVREHLDSLTDTYLTDNLGGALTTSQNHARVAVMEQGEPANVYASELLDEATCDNCADIDGKEYTSLAEAQADYPAGGHYACLGGSRCRGTLVAVFDETEADA